MFFHSTKYQGNQTKNKDIRMVWNNKSYYRGRYSIPTNKFLIFILYSNHSFTKRSDSWLPIISYKFWLCTTIRFVIQSKNNFKENSEPQGWTFPWWFFKLLLFGMLRHVKRNSLARNEACYLKNKVFFFNHHFFPS